VQMANPLAMAGVYVICSNGRLRPLFDTLRAVIFFRKEKMLINKRNTSVSLALECALLILAIFVFHWGLHAKLAQYHATSSPSNSTAKLLAETRTSRIAVLAEDQDPPRFALNPFQFAAILYSFRDTYYAADAIPVHIEAGPRVAGQYYLHGPDPKLRPPPALS
jgi:hypothetical protein